MPRPDDWFDRFGKAVVFGWVSLVCIGLLSLVMIACSLRSIHKLPAQSNSAFAEPLRDCVYRKLIEEPAWCPTEDQCVRPVVTREEIERHEKSCRKEGAQ